MGLTLIIDGNDFTALADRYGYSIGYEPREGVNSGIMLNGEKTVDILTDDIGDYVYKAVIEWELNDLTGAQLASIVAATRKPYVTVQFLDSALNSERTAVMIPTISTAKHAFSRGTAEWWKRPTLTLEEK